MEKSIIQILPALNQGGVERGTIEIAAALQKAGIQNYVISSGGKMVAELDKMGVEHITLPVRSKNPIRMWLNSLKFAKIFKEKNAALIHVRSRAPAWSVKWACAKVNIPYIATFHGHYSMKPEIFKKNYNRVMTQGAKVIAVSSFIKNHLMKDYGIKDPDICLIPRGAYINKFNLEKVSVAEKEAFIQEHQIDTSKPVITLGGRLSRIKGHSVLLDALKQMKHHNLTVLFVGGNPKGDYEKELSQKINDLPKGIDVKVFAVPGDKMPVVYAVTDIYVQPTLVPESFGRSIAEAQAMKRIVVASDHGGACELIRTNYSGFLTPVGDSRILANFLDSILDMPAKEKNEIAERGYDSVRYNYSIQKMCDRTLALYREFLK